MRLIQSWHRIDNYNNAFRTKPSNSRTDSLFEVTLDMRYSTFPRTRECTMNPCSPALAASFCCRPFAAVDV